MSDQRRSSGAPRREPKDTRYEAAGFDQLSRALEIARGDEDLARPTTPGRLPGAGTHVGPPVGAGDSLGPEQATDRGGLDRVADDSEPNSEHRGNGTNQPNEVDAASELPSGP